MEEEGQPRQRLRQEVRPLQQAHQVQEWRRVDLEGRRLEEVEGEAALLRLLEPFWVAEDLRRRVERPAASARHRLFLLQQTASRLLLRRVRQEVRPVVSRRQRPRPTPRSHRRLQQEVWQRERPRGEAVREPHPRRERDRLRQ